VAAFTALAREHECAIRAGAGALFLIREQVRFAELDDADRLKKSGARRFRSGHGLLAKGFKGPADFAVVPESDGLLVVVLDLVESQLRFVKLAR
jgi:hypothetical protein